MPAAKSDLLSYAGHEDADSVEVAAAITRPSSSSKNGGSSNTTSAKVACLACRKIKVRCLMPPNSPLSPPSAEGGVSTTSCLRCARLEIECRKTPHQKGGRPLRRVSIHRAGNSSSDVETRRQRGRSNSTVLYDWEVDVDDEEVRKEVEHQQMVTDPPSRLKNHSIKSILDSDDGQALHRLQNIGVNKNLSEKRTASSPQHYTTHRRESQSTSEPGQARTSIDIVRQGIFSIEETKQLHSYFFEKLHGIIALLTPSLNTFEILSSRRSTQFLFSAICTVSCRYVFEERYLQALQYTRTITSKFLDGAWPATIENCQALSILCMWRHPQDSSGWRKLHAAITMAYERNLHNIACKASAAATTTTTTTAGEASSSNEKGLSIEMVQAQRTFFHLGCFEEFFVNQRQLVPYIRWEHFPNARRWIESIGDHCLDIDIRIATAMDTISICRRLSKDLEEERARLPRGHAGSLQEIRLIKLALAEQKEATDLWLNAKAHGMKADFAMRPCGVFDNINYQLSYWQALFAIYCRPDMRGDAAAAHFYSQDREHAFNQASILATEMLETFQGPYGQNEYYRHLHEHVIYSLASATVWIIDNWNAMSRTLAVRAHNAMRHARNVTSPSKDRSWEQSAYLHNFLSFCCSKLPSLPVLHETSQIDINTVGISDDLRRLLQGSITQLSPTTAAFDELYHQAPTAGQGTASQHDPFLPAASTTLHIPQEGATETAMAGMNDPYYDAAGNSTTTTASSLGDVHHPVVVPDDAFLPEAYGYGDESVMQFFQRLLQDTPTMNW